MMEARNARRLNDMRGRLSYPEYRDEHQHWRPKECGKAYEEVRPETMPHIVTPLVGHEYECKGGYDADLEGHHADIGKEPSAHRHHGYIRATHHAAVLAHESIAVIQLDNEICGNAEEDERGPQVGVVHEASRPCCHCIEEREGEGETACGYAVL